MNVLDDWVHASSQTEGAEKERRNFKPVINNEMISYLYVNYIYQEKNWECPVCRADDGHCEHTHCMLCKELHLKDQAWKMRSSQRYKCRESIGDNEEKAY